MASRESSPPTLPDGTRLLQHRPAENRDNLAPGGLLGGSQGGPRAGRAVRGQEPALDTGGLGGHRAPFVADEMVASIAASGVRVVGNLERLREVPRGYEGDVPPEVRIPPVISASMAIGVLTASGVALRPGGTWIEPIDTARISTWTLAKVIARRAAGSAMRRSEGSAPPSGGEA